MFKSSILAVSTVAILALAIPSSFAPQVFAAQNGSSGGSSSQPSTPPGNPNDPGDPGGPGGGPGGPGGGGNGGDLPPLSDDEKIAQLEQTCNAAIGTLIKLPASMIEEFQGSVKVVPVCNSGLGHKVAIDNSQAAPLMGAIAGNDLLSGPLGHDGFKPSDVVGVVLVNGEVILYVHTFVA